MVKYLLTQTGLPHFVIALIFIGAVAYAEISMQSSSKRLSTVTIAPLADYSFEEQPIKKLDITKNSEQVNALVRLFTNSKEAFKSRETNPQFTALDKQAKLAVIISLAHAFFIKKSFSDAVKALEVLSEKQRLQNKLQFMYARSLSNIAEYDKAIKQYQQLLIAQPKSQAGTLNLGILLRRENRYKEAIEVFVRAIKISSGNIKAAAFSGKATCYMSLGEYKQAIVAYKKSIEYRPTKASTWMSLAGALAANNENLREVIKTFDRGIALDQRNYKYYIRKAKFQTINFSYFDAANTLKKALIFSSNAKLYEMMAWLQIEQANRSQANEFLSLLAKKSLTISQKKRGKLLNLYVDKKYKKLIKILNSKKKLTKEMHYLKAIAYRKSGFFDKASDILNKLSTSNQFGWRAKIHLARIDRSRGKYIEANKIYEKLLTHNYNVAFLWFENALVHENLLQPVSGLLKIKHAVNLQPKNIVYKLAKARLLAMSGKLSSAMEIVDLVLAQKKNYIKALKIKAELYAAKNDSNNQIKVYKHLIELQENDYTSKEKLAQAYITLGNIKEGQQLLLKILGEQSHNISVRYILANSYYQSNELTKSLGEVKKILLLDKDNKQAKDLKQLILSKIKEQQVETEDMILKEKLNN